MLVIGKQKDLQDKNVLSIKNMTEKEYQCKFHFLEVIKLPSIDSAFKNNLSQFISEFRNIIRSHYSNFIIKY